MTPDYWRKATKALSANDAVMKKLVKDFPQASMTSRGDPFSTLARSIVGQQISVKAAESVWHRVVTEVGDITPKKMLKKTEPKLRACGLSGRKVTYLHDLARHFHEGLLDPDKWNHEDDEIVITELTQVKGIGRWSAEMFLMFHLLRPNVLPLGDIGLQRAMEKHYNKGKPLTKIKMTKIAEAWQPWRSVSTWYMWRSLD
ncbi:MAG: DNA-3-methyladenine glycosylase, partial [Pseudomonadota bacterium]